MNGPGASPSENVELIRLPAAPEPPEAKDAPSPPTQLPPESLTEAKLRRAPAPTDVLLRDEWREHHERERHAADLKGHKNDIENRAKYTRRLFVLLCVWMGVVLLVIVGSGITPLPFKLSDAVLIALITGTTANVIGLFVIVARYLFTKR